MKLKNWGLGFIILEPSAKNLRVFHALKSVLAALPVLGISSVMLEGGPTLLTAALKEKLVDKIMWFISPKILGSDAKSVVGPLGFKNVKEAIRISAPVFFGLDGNILIEGRLN